MGHGTLDRIQLAALLVTAGVTQLIDVRRFPGSRHNPDVSREALEQWVPEAGIGYRWEERLGGRRRLAAAEESSDPWWRVEQFRAYAAHSRSPEFESGLDEVIAQAATERVAVMCSEAVWWRCHRRLIADVVVLGRAEPASHLMHNGKLTEHPPAPGARTRSDGRVVWDQD